MENPGGLGEPSGSLGPGWPEPHHLAECDGLGQKLLAGLDGWVTVVGLRKDPQALVAVANECCWVQGRWELLGDVTSVREHPGIFHTIQNCPEGSLLEEPSLV